MPNISDKYLKVSFSVRSFDHAYRLMEVELIVEEI